MKAIRLLSLILAFLGLVFFIGFSSASGFQQLIEGGDVAYERWSGGNFDFSTYRGRLEEAISNYQKALSLVPDGQVGAKEHVLDRLSQAYFELAFAYLGDPSAKESAFAKGKDYALKALRLDANFRYVGQGKGFRAALGSSTDVSAIFFYGNNLGSYLDYHWMVALSGGMKDVFASFERSLELEERYLGAGPHRALASFLIKVPGFLGGDREASKQHFEKSIQLAPHFLENYVDYAEYYAKDSLKDWDLFCQNLEAARRLAKDEKVMKKWPLYNTLAAKRANQLYGFKYRGKRVCGG